MTWDDGSKEGIITLPSDATSFDFHAGSDGIYKFILNAVGRSGSGDPARVATHYQAAQSPQPTGELAPSPTPISSSKTPDLLHDIFVDPIVVPLPTGVRALSIAAGTDHSWRLQATEKCMLGGTTGQGSSAIRTTIDRSIPVAVALPPNVTIRAIAAGFQQSLALDADGHVYAWGKHSQHWAQDTPVRVTFPNSVAIAAIAAGWGYSLALGRDGDVYGWGTNRNGELGDSTITDHTTPVLAVMPEYVAATAISAGYGHSLVMGSDGEVYTWQIPPPINMTGPNTQPPNRVVVDLPVTLLPRDISGGREVLGSDGKLYDTEDPACQTHCLLAVQCVKLRLAAIFGLQLGHSHLPLMARATFVGGARTGPVNLVMVHRLIGLHPRVSHFPMGLP